MDLPFGPSFSVLKNDVEEAVEVGEGKTIPAGKLVLSPTRTYAPIAARILKEHRGKLACT